MNADFVPDWPNLDLGEMPNGRFAVRCLRLLAAVPKVVLYGSLPRDADVVIRPVGDSGMVELRAGQVLAVEMKSTNVLVYFSPLSKRRH